MNKIILLLALPFMLFAFSSCSDDDECVATDSVGTYTGTKECDELDEEAVTFEVVNGGSDNLLIIDGVTVTIDECDIFGSSIVQGEGREFDGDIDGDEIHFVETIKSNSQDDVRCVWKGTKQ